MTLKPLDVESRQSLKQLPEAKVAQVSPTVGVSILYIVATLLSLPLWIAFMIVSFFCSLILRLADMALCRCSGYGSRPVTPADGFVVVTGASGGIGLEIARGYAQRGFDLVLVARSENKLSSLAEELRALGRTVHVVPCDLGKTDAATELFQRIKACNVEVAILVNNAAAGFGGAFVEVEIEKLRSMVNLNMVNLMELTYAFAKEMVNKGKGKIMNVSSIAGFTPVPLEAIYGATKAFVTSLSRAANYELRGTGVSITAVVAGVVDTGFFDAGGMNPIALKVPLGVQSAKGCAEQAIAGTARGESWVVPGPLCGTVNQGLVYLIKMAPEGYLCWLINLLFGAPSSN